MRLFELVLHLFHPRRSNNHRPRILHPDLILALAVLLIVGGLGLIQLPKYWQGWGDVLGYASSITIDQTLAQTNAKRAEVGLPALRLNSDLSSAALAKGQDMLNQQYWSHRSPSGLQPWDFMKSAGYRFSVAGENLARDFSTTDEMMQAWMRSPTHQANIVHPRYTEIGLAVIDGKLDGVETTLVVQMFGRPVSGQAQITTQGQQTTTIDTSDTSVSEVETNNQLAIIPTVSVSADSTVTGSTLTQLPLPILTEEPRAGVLASTLTFDGQLTSRPRYSPLQIAKSSVLSVIILLGLVLIYDHFAIGTRRSWRLVGKTPAHLLLMAVAVFFAVLIHAGRLG